MQRVQLILIQEEKSDMNLIEFGLILFLIIVLLIASVSDIRFQKIPNWLTYPTMFVGVAYHGIMNGLQAWFSVWRDWGWESQL